MGQTAEKTSNPVKMSSFKEKLIDLCGESPSFNQEFSTIIDREECSDEKIKLTRVNVPS
jgi:hypothetical protein